MKHPDEQYKNLIRFILSNGEKVTTPQKIDALTCFGTTAPLVYDLSNGTPIITERQLGIKGAIGEMCAFINGEQDFSIMKEKYSVPGPFWDPWISDEKCEKAGAKRGCLGGGSYGPAFAAFPDGEGGFDQIKNAIEMLSDEKLRNRRTIYVTSWIPFMNGYGGRQKSVITPCHGNLHFRVINGNLDLISDHRSADVLLGFPNDMISYCALLKMVESVTGLKARRLIFYLRDAHIYENQLEEAKEILARDSRVFPELVIKNTKKDIKEYRFDDFELVDYICHPKMIIPSAV
ncbi:MAG: thymidylate synthase [Candidatus Paceibacterota bacterium]